jgi:hypothetical protein
VGLFLKIHQIGRELVALHADPLPIDPLGDISYNLQEGDVIAPKFPQFDGHQVFFSPGKAFTPVVPAIWAFKVGKYQVCRAWGVARVGLPLTSEDIVAYATLLSSISKSLDLIHQLDEIIKQNGGFPLAI